MSDNLDFLLRKALRSGLLRISLHRNWDDGKAPNRPEWAASYLHVESNIIHYVDDHDPIDALMKAIRYGESDAKRRRAERGVIEDYDAKTTKVIRSNRKKVEAAELDKDRAVARRKRDMEDLI